MAILQVVRELVEIAERGGMTDEEFTRLLRYIVNSNDGQDDISSAPPSPTISTVTHEAVAARAFFGRGTYGWVNLERARDLDLVALLELGTTSNRSAVLDHIEKRWGGQLVESDLELLPSNKEPRWRKNYQWGFYYLEKEGFTRRPRRGIQELTDAGRSRAEDRRKSLSPGD
jgi:hypothetical protein